MNKYEKFISYIKKRNLGKIITNVSLKEYCTLHIGGLGLCMYIPDSKENLISAYTYIVYNKLSYYIIGKGSNLLISDGFHEKIFINLKNIHSTKIVDNKLYVDSGVLTNLLAKNVSKLGYSGLEFLAGIPGTIGGAIYMNAGAWNRQLSNVLESVTYLDEEGIICKYLVDNNQNGFGYRSSPFLNHKILILECVMKLKTLKDESIPYKVYLENLEKKKERQPIKVYSAGCAFKNPNGNKVWKLIEDAGCASLFVGDARISSKHYNFLINNGNASFEEMEELLKSIQENIYDKYLIKLELEWCILK